MVCIFVLDVDGDIYFFFDCLVGVIDLLLTKSTVASFATALSFSTEVFLLVYLIWGHGIQDGARRLILRRNARLLAHTSTIQGL